MGLIEDARLTDEERTACMWDPVGYGRLGEQVEIAIAEAQLVAALYTAADWMFDHHTALASMKIIRELEAAGLKRPEGR